jgi:hypothetical protein
MLLHSMKRRTNEKRGAMNLRNGLIALGIIVVFVILFLTGRNVLIKTTVKQGVKRTFGVELDTESISTGFIGSDLKVRNLMVESPEGFYQEPMVKIGSIYLDYDFWPLLKRKIHASNLEIAVEEVVVVKNREGRLNLDEFRKGLKKRASKKAENAREQNEKKAPDPDRVMVDLLSLSLERVVYKDYSLGAEPKTMTIDVGIHDLRFENVRSSEDLLEKVISMALKKAALGHVAEFLGMGKDGPRKKEAEDIFKSILKGFFKGLDLSKDKE